MDYVDTGAVGVVIEQRSKYMTDAIVDQLISCRKELNMTQQDIADATKMQRANIARIESKRREASLDSLVRYAECLQMQLRLHLQENRRNQSVNILPDADGNKIVFINDIRFKGKRKINWKEVETYLKEYVGACYEIADTAEKIYIGKEFPDEFTNSEDTKQLKGTGAKAKANAVQGLSEIIEIAANRVYAPNYNEKHRKDAKFGWYRYDSRFALPVYGEDGEVERYNVFSTRMLVRHAEDGRKYLYDLLRIKKETSKPLEQ